MHKLDLNFDKKDIELEINGEVYGFDLTKEKIKSMGDLENVAKDINAENEDEILDAIEDAIDMIYGDGTIDSIFGEHDTTRATLLELLMATIEAVKDYGSQFGVNVGASAKPNKEPVVLNRAQRRSQRKNK